MGSPGGDLNWWRPLWISILLTLPGAAAAREPSQARPPASAAARAEALALQDLELLEEVDLLLDWEILNEWDPVEDLPIPVASPRPQEPDRTEPKR